MNFILRPPLELICKIDGKRYFWSDFFQQAQSGPQLWVNFKFRSACQTRWTFQKQEPGKLVLYTINKCNAIELFHQKEEIESSRATYYEREEYFINYIDTARLAHEILLDPYYLTAIKESGIPIK